MKKQEDRIRDKNEARILKVAVDLFSRKGFDGTRITEIAKLSGLPKANIYYYFSGKEEIFTRIIEGLMFEWDAALEHLTAERDPRQAISDYVKAKLEYSRLHGVEMRFFANELLRGGRFFSVRQRAHMRRVNRKYVAVLNDWVAAGKLNISDPNHFFIILWGATEYYANFYTLTAVTFEKKSLSKRDFEKAHETIVSTVLDGCIPKLCLDD